MKQKNYLLDCVVAGAYAVKGLLLPIVAALLAIGPESVTMMSFAVGAIFVVSVGCLSSQARLQTEICLSLANVPWLSS